MNDDLISRKALRVEMETYVMPILANNLMGATDAYYRTLHLLDEAPAVDVEKVCEQMGLVKEAMDMAKAYLRPVRHGRWVVRSDTKGQVYCSECGTLEKITDSNFKSTYCPNCRAKMDGDSDLSEIKALADPPNDSDLEHMTRFAMQQALQRK